MALTLCLALPSDPVRAEAVHAQPADAFVESVGVATHLTWQSSIYAKRYNDVKAAMRELGVRYYRCDGGASAAKVAKDLYASIGAKGLFVIDRYNGEEHSTGLKAGSAKAVIAELTTQGTAGIFAVEGPNEYDHSGRPNWAQELRNYQTEIFNAIQGSPKWSDIIVGGSSLVTNAGNPGSSNKLGSLRNVTERGVHHDYVSGGRAPETNFKGAIAMLDRNNYVAGRPYLISETGICTNTKGNVGMCVSERAQAIYILRSYLDKFSQHQLNKTYNYEFVDQGTTQGNAAWDWGIVKKDFKRKPAFYALKNLITLLSDRGNASFTTSFLDYNIVGRDNKTREVLVQKKNGTFYLMVWRAEDSFTTNGDKDIRVAPKKMTLVMKKAATVKFYRPTPIDGVAPTEGIKSFKTVNNATSVPIDIADDVLVFEIGNGAATGRNLPSVEPGDNGASTGGNDGASGATKVTSALILSGGDANMKVSGKNWSKDSYFVGGATVNRGNIAIAGTTQDGLYQTERYGMSAYNIPVQNGKYTVRLHFAETFEGITKAGQRVFSFNVEGNQVRNFDVFKRAGKRNAAVVYNLTPVAVKDSVLNITFGGPGTPFINAIEVSQN